jgi:hypothetical protein
VNAYSTRHGSRHSLCRPRWAAPGLPGDVETLAALDA